MEQSVLAASPTHALLKAQSMGDICHFWQVTCPSMIIACHGGNRPSLSLAGS
jgi:hypothetical protein